MVEQGVGHYNLHLVPKVNLQCPYGNLDDKLGGFGAGGLESIHRASSLHLGVSIGAEASLGFRVHRVQHPSTQFPVAGGT